MAKWSEEKKALRRELRNRAKLMRPLIDIALRYKNRDYVAGKIFNFNNTNPRAAGKEQ